MFDSGEKYTLVFFHAALWGRTSGSDFCNSDSCESNDLAGKRDIKRSLREKGSFSHPGEKFKTLQLEKKFTMSALGKQITSRTKCLRPNSANGSKHYFAHTNLLRIMDQVVETLCQNLPDLAIRHAKSNAMSLKDYDFCLGCITTNLGDHYQQMNGRSWKRLKRAEMREEGLFYLLFAQGFVSFREIDGWLYLYEIQLLPEHTGQRLGTRLMQSLEMATKTAGLRGVQLTVFSANQGARKLYSRLGYVLTQDSPTPEMGRRGQIIEPMYYLLEKPL